MFPGPFPGLDEMRRNPNAMKEWQEDARRQVIVTAAMPIVGGVIGLILAAIMWAMN